MKKLLITIAYDGTNYFGWQKQSNVITIEGEIEKACSKIFIKGFELIGCSRTDKGVHALGQRATISAKSNIPTERICNALNANLPKDIVINDAKEVDLEFHPRYCAKQKTYEYKIVNSKYMIPQLRNFAEFIKIPLDISKMQQAAKYFVGEHDFKSFCASGTSVKTTVRTIKDVQIKKDNNIINMYFTGDGFLYNMVRIISGTLVEVGLNKIQAPNIPYIIEAKDRTKAGRTLSPVGLTLVEIKY